MDLAEKNRRSHNCDQERGKTFATQTGRNKYEKWRYRLLYWTQRGFWKQ